MFSSDYQNMLHARSHYNRGAVLDSKKCGCFFCLRIYEPALIDRWINEDTAVCPFCNVDSVLPESDDYELDDLLLLEMKEYWF